MSKYLKNWEFSYEHNNRGKGINDYWSSVILLRITQCLDKDLLLRDKKDKPQKSGVKFLKDCLFRMRAVFKCFAWGVWYFIGCPWRMKLIQIAENSWKSRTAHSKRDLKDNCTYMPFDGINKVLFRNVHFMFFHVKILLHIQMFVCNAVLKIYKELVNLLSAVVCNNSDMFAWNSHSTNFLAVL